MYEVGFYTAEVVRPLVQVPDLFGCRLKLQNPDPARKTASNVQGRLFQDAHAGGGPLEHAERSQIVVDQTIMFAVCVALD